MKNNSEKAVIIFNHALNKKAIELKERFKGKIDAYLFDSGSEIGDEEKSTFDRIFNNIYYNGLLNEANRFLKEHAYDVGMIITSDVEISDIDVLLKNMNHAFENKEIGVYAPSAVYSYHRHMNHKPGKGLVQVSYTEGFCFAARTGILDKLCPVDLSLNKYGYGTDTVLGYHALNQGYINVVDHSFFVDHPYGSGYNKYDAVRAKNTWIATLPRPQQLFYKIATKAILKNRTGAYVLNSIFRNKRQMP